jgi:hypothetical protein
MSVPLRKFICALALLGLFNIAALTFPWKLPVLALMVGKTSCLHKFLPYTKDISIVAAEHFSIEIVLRNCWDWQFGPGGRKYE